MYEFNPYFTNDGSVGLYNSEFDDIYHSAKGAVTEAYEKFIFPVDIDRLCTKDKIKVLDICYGIGYNSKSFLNFIFNKFLAENSLKVFNHADHNIDTVYTDNINGESYIYSDKVYTDKIFSKISVTAIDNDKILGFLSPFIKTSNIIVKNTKLNFNYKKVEKYICINKNQKLKKSLKINNLINYLIFEKISSKYPEIFCNNQVNSIINNRKYSQFLDSDIRSIYAYYTNHIHNNSCYLNKSTFLHNIYYNHISNKYKKDLKRYNLQEVDFDYICDDARNFIKSTTDMFNLIFLDAFTPSKCPCLWTFEFFKQLYNHLEDDGEILTYSTSAAVRGAMIQAGFYIGNIYSESEGKCSGTIASKNPACIKLPLSESDLGLIKTRAGIFYRDENLTGQNEAIIETRNSEIKNSDRLSSSQYYKNLGKYNS